jgi:hypothetical protein
LLLALQQTADYDFKDIRMPKNVRLDLVHQAISAGYRGQIEWKAACLERFLDDPQMSNLTEKGVRSLILGARQEQQWPDRS